MQHITEKEIQDEINQFLDEKYVRVMFDYSSSGLWQKSGVMAGDDWLPVTKDLLNRISTWVLIYDHDSWEHMSLSQDVEDGLRKIEDSSARIKELEDSCTQHYLEQVQIAIEIKKQLPDWTVVIFNEQELDLGLFVDPFQNSIIPIDYSLKR